MTELRRILLVVAGVLAVTAAGAVVWLAIGDGVRPSALDDLPATITRTTVGDVEVVAPAESDVRVGIVLLPGWRIEREAYVPTAAAVVDEAARVHAVGAAVAVPSVTLNTAFLERSAAEDARRALAEVHPSIDVWVLGGHSLGGLVGSTIVEEQPRRWDGWLGWAAVVPDDVTLADLGDQVAALTIAGSDDEVTPRAAVEGSLERLPPGTDVVVLEGATHQQFGAYDDERPDDAAVVDALAEATASWVATVAADTTG